LNTCGTQESAAAYNISGAHPMYIAYGTSPRELLGSIWISLDLNSTILAVIKSTRYSASEVTRSAVLVTLVGRDPLHRQHFSDLEIS
jgi:hypothetical protein